MINKTYKSKRYSEYVAPHQRPERVQDFDQHCKAYRESPARSKSRDEEDLECTFSPNSTYGLKKSTKDLVDRANELCATLEVKRHKIAEAGLNQHLKECPFKPSINKKSEVLAVGEVLT